MRNDLASTSSRFQTTLASLTLIALLSACGAKDAAPPAAAGPGAGAPPPPEVGVIVAQPQSVALQTELPGRVEPVRVAQVRARVNGVVQQRMFREGSEVKAGQPLFQIDASPYQATLASAQAAMGKAQANLTQASSQAERYKPLVAANAVSKQDYVNVIAAQKQAEADVAAARAAITTASINVNYARVVAPISGRIGRALVTEGALVSQTEATQLALIQQTNKVYINFTQSANDLQRLRRSFGGQTRNGAESVVPVTVLTDDGTELPNKGKLLFSDLSVDPTSGQVTLRAEMSNEDGALLPGQYVRVRLSQANVAGGILLPQQAVTRGTRGDTVLVIGADNKPTPRPVKVGNAQGSQWVVLEGLKPGEQVIVDGFQKMMAPGAPVKPVPWTAPATSAAAPAAAR
jgi:membrane fusion protein (multidrug efflux system)